MTANIIKIGNSRGVRIPKKVLEQYAMDGQVEMVLSDGGILLKPVVREPRTGWDTAFASMAAAGDDELLLDDVFADESFEE